MSRDALQAVEQLLGLSMSQDNDVEVLVNGEEIFPAMLDAIASAQHTIEFCTYVYWKGEPAEKVADALIAAADRGVEVRVVLDSFGCRWMSDEVRRRLNRSDCRIAWFRKFNWWLPFNNHRTHRKILVCDARVGFVGGVGIAEEWAGDARNPKEWRDTHFRIRGGMVRDLRAAFWDNWLENFPTDLPRHSRQHDSSDGSSSGAVVLSTANNHWSRMATLMHGLICQAEKSIDVCSPYFVPGRKLTHSLASAGKSGVKVRILTANAKNSDSRLSYLAGARYVPRLLRSGVHIYQYQPTFIHAKIMIVDGAVAVAGSSNLNQRSLKKDDEASFVSTDEAICSELTTQFERDLDDARELSLRRFRGRGWLSRLGELMARPFSDSV